MSALGLLRRLAMFADDVRAHHQVVEEGDDFRRLAGSMIINHCDTIANLLGDDLPESEQEEAGAIRAEIRVGA